MDEGLPEEAAALLERAAAGDERARQALVALLYDELRVIAHRQLQDQSPGHTLQTTALVNEAYLRIARAARPEGAGKGQFMALAASAMRSVLVDHARARNAAKRGGGRRAVELDELVQQYEERAVDLAALDEALARLAEIDPELARIVELRFFAGLSNEEIAQSLGVSKRTIERGWKTAQAWLAGAMGSEASAP
jgi:RNA polymerase sigma factor (TIGR02999 family)